MDKICENHLNCYNAILQPDQTSKRWDQISRVEARAHNLIWPTKISTKNTGLACCQKYPISQKSMNIKISIKISKCYSTKLSHCKRNCDLFCKNVAAHNFLKWPKILFAHEICLKYATTCSSFMRRNTNLSCSWEPWAILNFGKHGTICWNTVWDTITFKL